MGGVLVEDMLEHQVSWFRWFQREGLKELFDEINPVTDYQNCELRFVDYSFGDSRFDRGECLARGATYSSPTRVNTRLTIHSTGEIKEVELLLGHVPVMTEEGTFIIDGIELTVGPGPIRLAGATAAEVAAFDGRLAGMALQAHCRTGVRRMAQTIQERMATCDPGTATAARLIRYRPLAGAVTEFVERRGGVKG